MAVGTRILERLHVDSRYLYLKASRDWQDIELTDDSYEDEFGIRRQAAIRQFFAPPKEIAPFPLEAPVMVKAVTRKGFPVLLFNIKGTSW